MLFRRRVPLTFIQKMRQILWPSNGFYRLFSYVWQRILRMPGSAYSLAAGIATGVSISLTPFIGFHFLLIIAVCYLLRANILVGFISSLVGNPWTFPFMWIAAMNTGKYVFSLLGFETLASVDGFKDIVSQPMNVMTVWIMGGTILMCLTWPIMFGISYFGIKRWRHYRQLKRGLKAAPSFKTPTPKEGK